MKTSTGFHWLSVGALITGLISCSPTAKPAHSTIHLPISSPSNLDARILAYANANRAASGKRELARDTFLDALALEHARDSVRRGLQPGHSGFQYRFTRANQGIGATVYAENVHALPVATGDLARKFVDDWMASRVHRSNLLGSWNRTGIGVAKGPAGRVFAVQTFAAAP